MLHARETIRKVHITYDCGPQADSMLPAVPNYCHIGVIDPWVVTWLIYGPVVVLLFVDLNSEVDHVVVLVNEDSSGGLHGRGILREYHVLREVVLCAELGQVVATNLVGVEVGAGYSDHIRIVSLVGRLIRTVYVHCAREQLIHIVLVHLFVVHYSG